MELTVHKCFVQSHVAYLAILASVQEKIIETFSFFFFLQLSVGTNSGHK